MLRVFNCGDEEKSAVYALSMCMNLHMGRGWLTLYRHITHCRGLGLHMAHAGNLRLLIVASEAEG
jgi:hypothetical protein